MKKLTILIALFSSLAVSNAAPSFAEDGATPPTAQNTSPPGTGLDAKSLAEAVKSAMADMKSFKDEKSGYSIDYPSSWESKEVKPPMTFKIFGYNGQVNVNGAIDEVSTDTTAQMYADAVKEYMSTQPGYAFKIISEKAVKIAGIDGIQRVQQINHGNFSGHQIAVYFVTNSKAYQFNGTAITDEYPFFEPLFQKMIDSIKLEKVN